MAKNYYVLISKNEEGKVVFDELITHFAETLEEAKDFVLDTINPWIDDKFEDTEDLVNYLIELEDKMGFAPLFEIKEIIIKNENDKGEEEEATKKLVLDKLEELNSKVGTDEFYKAIRDFILHYLSLLPKEHQYLKLDSKKYVITDKKGARVI